MTGTILIFLSLLIVAVLAEPLANRLRVPFSAILVLLGFAGSELLVAMGIDTGLRWHNFNSLVMHLFVPLLVFESAFNLRVRLLLAHLLPVLLLAIPAMIIAGIITAGLLYFGINFPSAFPFTAALLTGIICSATDPVAVVELFKRLGAPEDLTTLLEGESLFNDATAIVLFTLLVSLSESGASLNASAALTEFGYTLTGGVLVGLVAGGLAALLNRLLKSAFHQTIVCLFTAFTALYLAEHLLNVSGVIAVLCSALILGESHRSIQRKENDFTESFWSFMAFMANAIVFLLVGATITAGMFTSHWLAMLLGIAGALVARFLMIYGFLPLTLRLVPSRRIKPEYKPIIWMGGLRGAIALALALSVPQSIESWYTIQSITYGVVLFTLFVQAPIMPWIVRRSLQRHND